MKGITRWSYAMGSMVLLAALAGVPRHTAQEPVLTRVAYIGGWPAVQDEAFAQFVRALSQVNPQWPQQMQFLHFNAGIDDVTAARLAVQQAVQAGAAVMVLPTGITALAARRLGVPIPAVFATYTDPMRDGIVDSMTSPHGMTGLSLADWLDEKRLDVLREAFDGLHRIGVLADREWVALFDVERRLAAYGQETGVQLTLFLAQDEADVITQLGSPTATRQQAWYIPPTFVSYVAEATIRTQLQRLRRPAMFGTTEEVQAGGQMAYAQDTSFAMPTLAEMLGRVLAGELPQHMPVERPRRFVLAVRLGDEFAVDVAPAVVRKADLVITAHAALPAVPR
tara:strand:- start:4214 stop:5227 length:1014 start_codon:yes stop_codon:yes gene_type:complete